jgi:hypothetical protein
LEYLHAWPLRSSLYHLKRGCYACQEFYLDARKRSGYTTVMGELPEELSEYFRSIGARGGKARSERLTASERKKSAKKAWRRSAEVRKARAAMKGKKK